MSDVQVNFGAAPAATAETPSEILIKDANRIVFVTDARGRKLGVKCADGALACFRLSRLLGADAGNAITMNMALTAASVVSVNDDPVPFPTTELQLEGLIDRLDADAFKVVSKLQHDEFGVGRSSDEEAEDAKN